MKNEPKPFVMKFYRVNIGIENQAGEKVGDITELTYKYYSPYGNSFVYSEPYGGNSWKYACEVPINDNLSVELFEEYLKRMNHYEKFYQWVLSREVAEEVARKAMADNNKDWTLESLYNVITKNNDFKVLAHEKNFKYQLTKTYQAKNPQDIRESIYVCGYWRLLVIDGKIVADSFYYGTYEVANLDNLYKVLSADDESGRIRYSKYIQA